MQMTGRDEAIYGRDAYIPAFTPVFSELDLNCPVKDGDKLLGFTIRDVLPERRWAIRENGTLLGENEFRQRYLEWASKVSRGGRVIPIASVNGLFDASLVPVPTPAAFVSVAHDFQGREIRIGFDPNKAPEKGKFILRDGEGREVDPLAPSAKKVERMTVLAELQEKGVLSPEQLAKELSSTLAVPVRIEEPPTTTGATNRERVPNREEVTALCGRSCKGNAGKLAHERKCVRCRAVAAEQSQEPLDGAA